MIKTINKIAAAVFSLFYTGVSVLADTNPPADRGLSNAPGVDITVQSLLATFLALACYATKIIMVVMVIMIIWYGFKMMSSQGSDTKFTAAKKSLTYAVIGILVIMGANTIIATVGNSVVAVGSQNLSTRSQNFINYTPLGGCSF